MSLQFFCLDRDIFKPACGLEFFSVGTPECLASIYTLDGHQNLTSLAHGDARYYLAGRSDHGRTERDYVVLGSLNGISVWL
jgi:hypothetical protein